MKVVSPLFERFVLDDGFEQPVLVGEIDVERALGDAGGAGDLVHAGPIKAQIHEHLAGAVQDLTAFRTVFVPKGDEFVFVADATIGLSSRERIRTRDAARRGSRIMVHAAGIYLDRTVRSMVLLIVVSMRPVVGFACFAVS